jgi:FKBP-type peptidyl-prolyl cis-trans isomerase FklB
MKNNFLSASFLFPACLLAGGFLAASAAGQEVRLGAQNFTAPDEKKVSYALGMDLGLQIKRIGADVDVNTIIQAMRDVQDGKPTQLKESDLRPIFHQEEVVERARQSAKNKAEGDAYLATNGKDKDVVVLPDGLQYRVVEAALGETPKASDTVVVNYKGTLVDGTVFDHKDNYEIPVTAPIKGWQEALTRMKVGAKWRIVVPSSLAYGHKAMGAIGPDATLIFDIELLSIKPAPTQ